MHRMVLLSWPSYLYFIDRHFCRIASAEIEFMITHNSFFFFLLILSHIEYAVGYARANDDKTRETVAKRDSRNRHFATLFTLLQMPTHPLSRRTRDEPIREIYGGCPTNDEP